MTAVTYPCRHDDHATCPAPGLCGCSCHGQLTLDVKAAGR